MFGALDRFDWVLTPPLGGPSGLHVAFALTRTQILAVELELDDGMLHALRVLPGLRFYGITGSLVAQARALRVFFDGDPPALAHLLWTQEDDGERIPPVVPLTWKSVPDGETPDCRELCPCAVATNARIVPPTKLKKELARLSPTTHKLYRMRRMAVDWHARAQEFFLRMDLETEPEFIPQRWLETIQRMGQRLEYRIMVRACSGNDGLCPTFPPIVTQGSEDPFELEDLTNVSLFLVNMIRADLESHGGPKLVAWAFEMFATDRLIVHHVDLDAHGLLRGHGAANGLLFLQFAELGFACVENGIDADFWNCYLPVFVESAHAFLETARDASTSPTLAPTPQHYEFKDGRFHCRERLEELREEREAAAYIAATTGGSERAFLEERFTSLVASAYPNARGRAPYPTRCIHKGHEATVLPRGCPETVVDPAPDA